MISGYKITHICSLISIGDLQIGGVPSNMVPALHNEHLSFFFFQPLTPIETHSSLQAFPPKMSSSTLEWCNASPQLFLFIIETISDDHSPLSLSLPSWREPRRPRVTAVEASASFFWTSWKDARGRLNWFL